MKIIGKILLTIITLTLFTASAKNTDNANMNKNTSTLIGIHLSYGGGMTKGRHYSLMPENYGLEEESTPVLLMEADNDQLSHHFNDYEMPPDTLERMRKTAYELRLENLPDHKPKRKIPGIEMLDGSNEYSITLYYNGEKSVIKTDSDNTAEKLEKFFGELAEQEKARKDNVIIRKFNLGENVDYNNPKAHIGAKEYHLKEKSKDVYEVYASTFNEDGKYGNYENYGENLTEKDISGILDTIKNDFEKNLVPMNKSKYKVSMQRNIGRGIYQGIDEKTAEKLITAFEKLKKAK